MTSIKQIIVLLLISGITFCISNFVLDGTLNKTTNLSGELKSPPDSLYQWKIADEPPFKYRVLHKLIVSGTYHLVSGLQDNNVAFFIIYKIETFLLHFLAILAFYYFLTQINLSEYALVGAILFAILPPLFLAYNVPVHTREDTLAYCILILGLLSIIKNNVFLILLFAVLGVLCRETLMLLPFVNLFFNRNQNIYARLLISACSFGVFFIIRWYYGMEKYNYWEGLHWNISNLEQVIGFGYITFSFLWIPFFFSLIRKKIHAQRQELIYKSSLAVLLLIIITTFIGGIFNEIRILYLLAPWVIPIGLSHYKEHRAEIISELISKKFQLYACVILLFMIASTSYVLSIVQNYLNSQHDIPYTTWIITAAFQLYLGFLCLPYFYKLVKKEYL